MKTDKLKNFKRGWIIGDFVPSLLRTKKFEFAVQYYDSGHVEEVHFHKIAHEYTIIVSGRYKVNVTIYEEGDIIHFEPNDVSHFECLEKGATAVVKIPSVKGDKYIIQNNEKK